MSPVACLIVAGRKDPGFAETGEPTPGGPFRPLDEELPVRERYEAPPPAVGGKEWLGAEVDRAFGFPVKPPAEPGVIEVSEAVKRLSIERPTGYECPAIETTGDER